VTITGASRAVEGRPPLASGDRRWFDPGRQRAHAPDHYRIQSRIVTMLLVTHGRGRTRIEVGNRVAVAYSYSEARDSGRGA
jgi:hypothetical protein